MLLSFRTLVISKLALTVAASLGEFYLIPSCKRERVIHNGELVLLVLTVVCFNVNEDFRHVHRCRVGWRTEYEDYDHNCYNCN